jgi:hypothetical protein
MPKDRTTILFGNGLGMALDPEYFSLSTAMDYVWNQSACLNDIQKNLVLRCLKVQRIGRQPESESDLYTLHLTTNACEFLNSISDDELLWLNDQGSEFPLATRRYLTEVAWYFHHHSHVLPESFLRPLFDFIKASKTHIATLNYDNLMYQKFIEEGILHGYDGWLVDGFYDSGFESENLVRMYDRDFGYYLHLHGSPLYIDSGNHIIKQKQGYSSIIPTKHIVLTHIDHKQTVIDSSYVLRSYWEYLNLALQESKNLILFGYSGLDTHLNKLIQAQSNDIKISVIEWKNGNSKKVRENSWKSFVGKDEIQLYQLKNILKVNNWYL